MKNILFVNACIRPQSRTLVLAREVLSRLSGRIEELNISGEDIRPLNWELLQERERLISQKAFSAPMFRYANQFIRADEIVVAAPAWDMSFPSVLRVYFEHITVTGLTFKYSPEGIPIGFCRAKRLIYVTTSGGPFESQSKGYQYIRDLAGTLYGIPDIMCFKVENLDIKGADVNGIMQAAIRDIQRADL